MACANVLVARDLSDTTDSAVETSAMFEKDRALHVELRIM